MGFFKNILFKVWQVQEVKNKYINKNINKINESKQIKYSD